MENKGFFRQKKKKEKKDLNAFMNNIAIIITVNLTYGIEKFMTWYFWTKRSTEKDNTFYL